MDLLQVNLVHTNIHRVHLKSSILMMQSQKASSYPPLKENKTINLDHKMVGVIGGSNDIASVIRGLRKRSPETQRPSH